MKTCLNCKSKVRDNDLYCRNCGILLRKNISYILINIWIILIVIAIIGMIVLFIASYLVNN